MRIAHFRAPVLFLSAALTLFSVPTARAAYTIDILQVGPDVVATGSGSIDTTDLTVDAIPGHISGFMDPNSNDVFVGSADDPEKCFPVTGPASFGPGGGKEADSTSGVIVGSNLDTLSLPGGYSSGAELGISTATWSGQTFSTLGLTPGTYLYTWGTFRNADSFTVQIGPVPEPASLSLLTLAGIAMLRRRSRLFPRGRRSEVSKGALLRSDL